MKNNKYDLLSYGKWNRRLINLYWIFCIISLVTEIILFFYQYLEQLLWITPGEYIFTLIIFPTIFMFLITAVCETIILLTENRFREIQPYVMTFTCVALSTVLLVTHYGITVLCSAYIIPVIFSLVYDNRRVLRGTLLFSILIFAAVYVFYLSNIELPYLRMAFGDVITNFALLIAAYLICKLVLNRNREVIDIMAAVERSAYEADIAKNRAEAESKARARFLANMSHEIRTPLNSIIGLTELALDGEVFSHKGNDYLVKVKNSAVGLLDIVNDILDMSKIDAGAIVLENRPFLLSEILAECEAITAYDANKKGLRVYFYDKTTLNSGIIGDPTRLRQALVNLLSNAVKFTQKGSVTLIASGEAAPESNKALLYFEIKDTGIGITKEHLQDIFEPFRQANESITRNYGGTGLGLSITRSIIETMGGKITVESIPNIGSRFKFSLEFEVINDEHTYDDAAVVSTERPSFTGDILLCEDNALSCQVAKENLEKLGFSVITAENGKAAIEIAERHIKENRTLEIVFMDIYMPVMDGIQAAKKLKELNIKAPIIALTANILECDKKAYMDAGMSECLSKPFRTQELYACLLNHLTPVRTVAPKTNKPDKDYNVPVNIALGVEYNAESEKLYYKSLNSFVENQPKTLTSLEKAITDADFALASLTAHTAKNNAYLIGATKLGELLAVIEESLRHDGSYFNKETLDECWNEFHRVLDYISTGIRPSV